MNDARHEWIGRQSHRNLLVRGRKRGAALLWALVAVVIISSFVFGITSYATNHFALAQTQQNAESALALADAAIMYEMNLMSRREFDGTTAIHNFGSPYVGALPVSGNPIGVPGGGHGLIGSGPSGEVSIEVSNIQKNGTWSAPNHFWITAEAKVWMSADQSKYVVRQVNAMGRGVTPTDLYAAYGYSSLDFNGSSLTIDTDPDSLARFIGSAKSVRLPTVVSYPGTVLLDRTGGIDAVWNGTPPSIDWMTTGYTPIVPIVAGFAAKMQSQLGLGSQPDPIAYFATHNDNDDGNGGGIFTRATAGGTAVAVLGTNRINASTWGSNDVVVIKGRTDLFGGLPRGSIIYLEELAVPAGKTLEIQSGLEGTELHGPVRIFIGPYSDAASGAIDLTQGTLLVNTGDRESFQIYNATGSPVQISSTMAMSNMATIPESGFWGLVHSLNFRGGVLFGTIALSGDLTIYGGTFANTLQHSGGALHYGPRFRQDINGYPQGTDALSLLGRYVLFYRIDRTTPQGKAVPTIKGYEEDARVSSQAGER